MPAVMPPKTTQENQFIQDSLPYLRKRMMMEERFIYAKKCGCCYSPDGLFCAVRFYESQKLIHVPAAPIVVELPFPGMFTEPSTRDENGKRYHLCKKCGCCYSPDGLFCAVLMNQYREMNLLKEPNSIPDTATSLVVAEIESFPGKFIEPTQIDENGKTFHLCKSCCCCYSSDGFFCAVLSHYRKQC